MKVIIALLIFGLLIVIHELGHFLLAKKNGICVYEFSVGMGPRLFSFKKGETKYSIKLFPFGGSCMMMGEDEDMDDEGAFNNKSVWARMAVIFAGPFFNFLLGFILSIILIGIIGIDKPNVNYVKEDGAAYEAGIKEGDIVTKINGKDIDVGREAYNYELFYGLDDTVTVTVLRDGKEITFDVNTRYTYFGIGISYTADSNPIEITQIVEGGPLDKAGIKTGDVITKIDNVDLPDGESLYNYVSEHPFTSDSVLITFVRNNKEHTISVTPTEIVGHSLDMNINMQREKTGVVDTVKYSFVEMKYQVTTVFESFKYIFRGKASMDDVSGPVGVVNFIGDTYEKSKSDGALYVILNMFNISILLSVNLGIMNLLPIPALDGGRLLFLIIEAIRRKKVPAEKEAMVHFIGLIILLLFMVIVMVNDIKNVFF